MSKKPCPLCEALRVQSCRFCQEEREIQAVLDGSKLWTLLEGDAAGIVNSNLRGKVHLAYVDPCFATGKVFKTKRGEIAFDDRFRSAEAFWEYLGGLLSACHRALAPEGSLVVHCDARFQPGVRRLLDELFGANGFCDQIVWRYRRWPAPARHLQRMHDYLIRYALDPKEARFNQLFEPLSDSTRATWGAARQKAMIRDGVRRRSITTDQKSPGAPLSDVWEIPIIAPSSKERTGYPTQKPEALLERVVSAFSKEGDVVLDGTAGAATTGAVALRLGRRCILIDRSEVAIRYALDRLANLRMPYFQGPEASPLGVHRSGADGPSHRGMTDGEVPVRADAVVCPSPGGLDG